MSCVKLFVRFTTTLDDKKTLMQSITFAGTRSAVKLINRTI